MRLEAQAGLSGFAIAVGVAVLLQQFGVWPLTFVTLVALPLVVGGGSAAIVARRRRGTEDQP